MFNPDGNEFEKSGNGLRIFCKYLYDNYSVKYNIELNKPFYIRLNKTKEIIKSIMLNDNIIKVDIGKPRFNPLSIPCTNTKCKQVINQIMNIKYNGNILNIKYSAINVGNPHCVILMNDVKTELFKKGYINNTSIFNGVEWIKTLGPLIETNIKLFPNKINVQFMDIIDDYNIFILIWERGVGYTLSSGTSCCATSTVAYTLNLIESNKVNVNMKGWILTVDILEKGNDDLFLTLTGPVTIACEGIVYCLDNKNYPLL